MDYLAIPPAREVRGTIAVPPSKSATNRALVLAALSRTPVEIVGPLDSEDTRALAACLAAMGANVAISPRLLRVGGPLSGPSDREVALDAKDSGTAARFLTAIAAAIPGRFLLTGSKRLCERPQGELVAALRSAGADIEYAGESGCLPLRIAGGSLRSGSIAVDASRSSQFLSALLLAAPALEGGLEVAPSSDIASAPYVGTTLECLRAFGHQVSVEGPPSDAAGVASRPIRVVAGPGTSRYEVPGDYSSALPLLASCGAASGTVTVTGLTWPSADADAGALPALQEMGVTIEGRPGAVTARSRGELRAVTVSASDFPDAVPTLAALAALADGDSRFEGIGHLRLKESDRIGSLAALLDRAGARAEAEETSLVVRGPARRRDGGGELRKISTFGDHRIAMAASLLSLALPGLLVENPGCVAKSYPNFFRDLESLTIRS